MIHLSMYRGTDYQNFQSALEDCATYSVNHLDSIEQLSLNDFQLVGGMTVAEMFGHTHESIMIAVHTDTDLIAEIVATNLSQDWINKIKGNEMNTTSYIVIGWNYETGSGVKIPMNLSGKTDSERYHQANVTFRKIAEERCGNGDSLWVVGIIPNTELNSIYVTDQNVGYDRWGFEIPKKKFKYSLTTNVIWFGADYGEVEASSIDEARKIAQEKIKRHIDRINERISGIDKIEIDLELIEVEEI